MRSKILILSVVVLYGVLTQCTMGQDATNAASFLKIGSGAKATSLGGAFVAVADDASAGYWNPAGLAQLKGLIVSLADRTPIVDTNFANIAIASPIWKIGYIGLNVIYYDCGDVIMYDSNAKNTGTLDDREAAVILSYAYNLNQLMLGASAKYIYQNMNADDIGASSFDGVGADISVLYKIFKNLSVGSTFHSRYEIHSRYETDDAEGVSNVSPFNIRAGACYKIGIGKDNSLNFMMDFDQTKKYPLKLHLGTELVLFGSFALRAGLANLYAESEGTNIDYVDLVKHGVKPTFGLGFKWKLGKSTEQNALVFDYAVSIEKNGLNNFFTLAYQF